MPNGIYIALVLTPVVLNSAYRIAIHPQARIPARDIGPPYSIGKPNILAYRGWTSSYHFLPRRVSRDCCTLQAINKDAPPVKV